MTVNYTSIKGHALYSLCHIVGTFARAIQCIYFEVITGAFNKIVDNMYVVKWLVMQSLPQL